MQAAWPRARSGFKKGHAMAANKKLLILPGDGIGPEVMREVRRVIDWMDRRRMVTFDVSDDHVGG
jgi:3-isopropylmalate dehydrogenase